MPFVQVRDIDVYYEIHGDGERVVLVSGTGGDLRQNPIRGQGVLESQFEVLMYDQRGLGQTSKPDSPYTMADYADDCAALMAALGWDRAHVVGVSFGGMVAQHIAIRHPERVSRLALVCTSAGGAGGSSLDLLAVSALPVEEQLPARLSMLDSRNDMTTQPPTLAPMFDILLPMLSPSEPLNADDPDWAMGARRQLEARADHNTWDDLVHVTAPTLVAGGRFDLLAPVDNVARLAERIPGATLAMFDGGHLFMVQDPTAWPSIAQFLAGRDTAE